MTARYLGQLNAGAEVSDAARRLISSGAHLQTQVDLGTICAEEVEQLRGAYPGSRVQLNVAGDCQGLWDGRRVQQLLGNLVVNAIHHGEPDAPVRVTVMGTQSGICTQVSNSGPAIESATLMQLFEPLKRGPTNKRHSGLGLGLNIVREIAKGHGGTAEVHSDDRETVFTVLLPRRK